MYLRTPKRYTARGSKRRLVNLKWLWLYLLAPVILIPAVLVWDYRDVISPIIESRIRSFNINLNPPTPTATITPKDYGKLLSDAFNSGNIDRYISLLKTFTLEVVPNDASVSSTLAQFIILRAYDANPDPARLQAAYQAGQQAINANPEAADGWTSMALVLDWSGKPQQALPYALHARDLDAQNPMALAVLGEIYHDLQKDDTAAKLVDQAIAAARAAKPVNRVALSHAYWVQAKILTVTSVDGKDAINAYAQAWEVASADPPDPAVPIGYIASDLSINYMNVQQTNLAISVAVKAVELDKDDPLLSYRLGMIYMNQGDAPKARTYFSACHDLEPNQAKCLYQLAILAYRESNFQQTVEYLQPIIDQGAKDMNVYLLMGKAYIARNDCSAAIPVLHQGVPFIEDSKDRAALETALQQCGDSTGLAVETPEATLTPTLEPTKSGARPTPTARKR